MDLKKGKILFLVIPIQFLCIHLLAALERMREDFDKENERKLRGGHDLICSLIRIQK